jgi:hypothetical protein
LEIVKKQQAKFDPEMTKQAMEWIESVLGESLPDPDFQKCLKDGVILCK